MKAVISLSLLFCGALSFVGCADDSSPANATTPTPVPAVVTYPLNGTYSFSSIGCENSQASAASYIQGLMTKGFEKNANFQVTLKDKEMTWSNVELSTLYASFVHPYCVVSLISDVEFPAANQMKIINLKGSICSAECPNSCPMDVAKYQKDLMSTFDYLGRTISYTASGSSLKIGLFPSNPVYCEGSDGKTLGGVQVNLTKK